VASLSKNRLAEVFNSRQTEITSEWLEQLAASDKRGSTTGKQEIARHSREFVQLLADSIQSDSDDVLSSHWTPVRDFLVDLTATRVRDGYTAAETASFIFSLKQTLFSVLGRELRSEPEVLAAAVLETTHLLDKLGLLTVDAFQKSRESVINRQQQELMELSTPVVRLWDNILALPLIGTLDSSRTQVVMQNLLEAIVETRSDFAIIDITGVPTVDTLVAQHLLKTVAAARLMGADCLISGIRPQIAQTIIHLGVNLSEVTTKATLADAFLVALRRSGHAITKDGAKAVARS
jgi:rsbT co-antagonist protein RsbR